MCGWHYFPSSVLHGYEYEYGHFDPPKTCTCDHSVVGAQEPPRCLVVFGHFHRQSNQFHV